MVINMSEFKLCSDYKPMGDQPDAIDKLSAGVEAGERFQTLMGVTGSGKTFTMANIIAKVNKPTLILSHNKTLAAQLCSEFREFFPENAVEFFVSYYDYYQPEAYIPGKDVYIEKDSADAVMFNLGWLPGAEHGVTTYTETTLQAVNAALEVLREDGVMTICVYPGHDEGAREREALIEWAQQLDEKKYDAMLRCYLNQSKSPPLMIAVKKNKTRRK